MSDLSFMEKLLGGLEVEWVPLTKLLSHKGYIRGPFGSALKKSFFVPEGVPVYEQQHAIYDKREFRYFIDNERAQSLKRFSVKPNDIIISCSGTIGKISIIKEQDKIGVINQALLIMRFDLSKVNIKYIKHYFECFPNLIVSSSGGAITNIEKRTVIEKIKFPIPCPDNSEKSLEIQAEIVRILDTFTELTTRKKQYNYYRDQLLSFEEGEVEWKMLGEVAKYSKTRISSAQLDETNYVGVDNLLQNRAGKTESNYVPTSGNSTEYHESDILIGNIRPYLKKIWHADRVGGTNGDVLVIHITDQTVNSRYLYQILADDKFFEYNMQHAKGAKMPRGNKPKIMEYSIPIPKNEAEQARIFSILDKFDTLTHSISKQVSKGQVPN